MGWLLCHMMLIEAEQVGEFYCECDENAIEEEKRGNWKSRSLLLPSFEYRQNITTEGDAHKPHVKIC
jgi:hypothetical protein